VPVCALPPILPFTSQSTAVLVVPVTEVLNCWVAPGLSVTLSGEMGAILIEGDGGDEGGEGLVPPLPPPPQLTKISKDKMHELRLSTAENFRLRGLAKWRCIGNPICGVKYVAPSR
jgi:hypothetical protein